MYRKYIETETHKNTGLLSYMAIKVYFRATVRQFLVVSALEWDKPIYIRLSCPKRQLIMIIESKKQRKKKQKKTKNKQSLQQHTNPQTPFIHSIILYYAQCSTEGNIQKYFTKYKML